MIYNYMSMFNNSEKAKSVDDYKIICMEFISDISNDYKEWVSRYKLDNNEHKFRIEMIDYIVAMTNSWIAKYGDTIKKIDIIKEDGLKKMAEFTAGYPFKFHIYIDGSELYTAHKAEKITLEVIAEASKADRKVRITDLRKGEFAEILSNSTISLLNNKYNAAQSIHEYLILDASKCNNSDIISVTLAVEEINNDIQLDKRGLSIIIRII